MWAEWGRQDTLINTAYKRDCSVSYKDVTRRERSQ